MIKNYTSQNITNYTYYEQNLNKYKVKHETAYIVLHE